ncbi:MULTISPECIES: DUF6264 family protein [unclassified Microbacterium]|uniref:DUF6264 family protein n=1 Tax=unclassified Microbacterium TaxID=2609290 RepID=UPI001E4958D7|nr:DUF6264 family protein [Microbacterium sp. Au-Mic1]MCE4027129.1 DUF6264 family protein [Microbacterium sp. Au-Mic1]
MTDSGSAEQSRRPAFGEYATPEEQSRRAGRPLPPPVVHTPPAAAPVAQPGAPAADVAERPAHPVDRMASIALLAYGLWNVITSTFAFLNPSSLMATMMQAVGISGTFSNYQQARVWGIVAGILLIVGWVATAAWTVLRLRRGKLTWWLPVAGGVVFVLLTTICMMVPFFTDPAVISYLNERMQQ